MAVEEFNFVPVSEYKCTLILNIAGRMIEFNVFEDLLSIGRSDLSDLCLFFPKRKGGWVQFSLKIFHGIQLHCLKNPFRYFGGRSREVLLYTWCLTKENSKY